MLRLFVPWYALVALLVLFSVGLPIPGAPAAPLVQACSPRPPVDVTVTFVAPGRLQATIAATGTGNALQQLRFQAGSNVRVEVDGIAHALPYAASLPAGTTAKTFGVLQQSPGQAATITQLIVVDGCGEWPTLIGGGATGFVPTPTGTRTFTPTATASVTGLFPPAPSPTATSTGTPTPPLTATATTAPTSTATPTNTPTATATPTATDTPTATYTPTLTPTDTPTVTATPTPSDTPTPTVTATPSDTATATATGTASATATLTPTATATPCIPAQNCIVSPDTAGDVGRFTALGLDASGNPVVSYWDGTNLLLKVLHCGNPTCTAPSGCGVGQNCVVSADTTFDSGTASSLQLDAAGNPVVTYYVATDALDLRLLHCGNPTCTAPPGCGVGQNCIVTLDSVGDEGWSSSVQLDSGGNPVVSYYDQGDGDLKVLHCGNPTCTAGNTIAVPDTAGIVGEYSSLQLDASGNPVVSYWDNTNVRLKVLHCGDPSCNSGNVITVPDPAPGIGAMTSLRLDASGNPVVSHWDYYAGVLRVLHCGDSNCTAPLGCGAGQTCITSPDVNGDVGGYTALALDGAGDPVVGYYDFDNGDLRVLHCGNATCTAGNTVAITDTAGDVGRYVGLALDATGDPVVSYWDVTDADLRVLHCGDATCIDPGGPRPPGPRLPGPRPTGPHSPGLRR